ncbi:DUF1223 domain-containing protein [Sandarakinorhabdus sp. AAP62]|uniref:DUF1223 domain-containing protein n=1 Tax=Sandarakinorhabdus sp. AAP62 TaxID=1248916 RepID=UPI00031C3B7C|nr:DUF1223 domain-containing protein [Sandarakinorhabdus sp. AAP62]
MRLALLALAASLAAPALAADAAHPTVIELFQSQGCSSCPPANANVMALADRPDLLVLSFGVTYWDQLGWKDRFAKPEFTRRQYDYRDGLRHDNVWTPQTIINGRVDVTGVRAAELAQAVKAGDRGTGGPAVSATTSRIEVAAGKGVGDVWLVRYNPNIVQVPIKAGENGGRTLPHRNVVTGLVRLGAWSGSAAGFARPAPVAGLSEAVLVQRPGGGPVLAALKLK